MWNDRFEVPTFEEVLELRERLTRELGREVGVYPETKHPTFFDEAGLDLEAKVADAVRRHHLDRRNAPIYIQSFELPASSSCATSTGSERRSSSS